MQDIHDIKPVLDTIPFSKNSVIIVLIILIIVLIVYFLKKRKSELNHPIKLEIKSPTFKPQIFLKKLENLEKNINTDGFKDFYNKFSRILVEYLETKGYENISKKTINEIRKIILEKNIFQLIQKTYFYNFDEKQKDSISSRKNNIDELKKLIIIDYK